MLPNGITRYDTSGCAFSSDLRSNAVECEGIIIIAARTRLPCMGHMIPLIPHVVRPLPRYYMQDPWVNRGKGLLLAIITTTIAHYYRQLPCPTSALAELMRQK